MITKDKFTESLQKTLNKNGVEMSKESGWLLFKDIINVVIVDNVLKDEDNKISLAGIGVFEMLKAKARGAKEGLVDYVPKMKWRPSTRIDAYLEDATGQIPDPERRAAKLKELEEAGQTTNLPVIEGETDPERIAEIVASRADPLVIGEKAGEEMTGENIPLEHEEAGEDPPGENIPLEHEEAGKIGEQGEDPDAGLELTVDGHDTQADESGCEVETINETDDSGCEAEVTDDFADEFGDDFGDITDEDIEKTIVEPEEEKTVVEPEIIPEEEKEKVEELEDTKSPGKDVLIISDDEFGDEF